MSRSDLIAIAAVLLLALSGCLGLPVQPVEFTDYDLGPVTSNEFPELLRNAIGKDEGEPKVFGRIEWFGFRDDRSFPVQERYIRAVAALTNTDVLLLEWHEPDGRYKVVKRFPYTEFESVASAGYGARTVYLYFKDRELTLEDRHFIISERTTLNFLKPSGVTIERQKNEAAFLVLKEKIKPHESAARTHNSSNDGY